MSDEEEQKRRQDAIAALPPKYQKILELTTQSNASYEDIASELGLTLPALKTRLHRARRKVRQMLGNFDE